MLRRSDLELGDAVIAACARFRQGSIIRDIVIAFTADEQYSITKAAREQVTQENSIVRVAAPIAIVTLQTCDLRNPKRMAIRPFVSVARVFDAHSEFDKNHIGNIALGRIGDLIPLTGPTIRPEEGLWVADLRLEGVIERGVLVGKEPEDGFEDDEGYFGFQRSIAAIRGRSAIDDRVLEHILRPLREWLEAEAEQSDLIEEIRVRALPTILAANSVELYFLTFDDVDPAGVQESANTWYASVSEHLPPDLQLLDVSVVPTSAFSRGEEIGTERVDFDDLSQ